MTSTPDVEPPCQASSSAFPKALPSGLAVLQVTAWPAQNSTACLCCLLHSMEGWSLIPSLRWGVLCCTAPQTREWESPGCSCLQQQEPEVAFFIPSAREGGFTCRNYATRNRVFSCSLPLSVYKVLNTSPGRTRDYSCPSPGSVALPAANYKFSLALLSPVTCLLKQGLSLFLYFCLTVAAKPEPAPIQPLPSTSPISPTLREKQICH